MKLWKKAMVLALSISMSAFAASCSLDVLDQFLNPGTSSESSADSESTPAGESTPEESTPDESTPDESTPGGETPGGDVTPEVEKYTIKFVNLDGTVISEAEYEEGATVVVPADLDPIEADGYRYAFAGWGEVSATAVADATYTAIYSVEGVAIEYTISFNHPKTGMPLAAPITFTVDTISSIVFPEVPADLAPDGYQAAWDKTVADVTLADLQVTPVFTAIEYQVTFVHPKTGMPIAEPITYTVDNMYDVVFPAIPEGYQMPGYTMTWDKTPADLQIGGTVVSLGTPVANTYAIIYKMGDGSETQQVVYDSEFTLLVPTREGYNFEGWYIVRENAVTDEKLEEGIWMIEGNVVVEAKWSFPEGEYAMKYVFNESSETVSQVTKKAYEGGSTVSFQYYIPAGTPTSWWGLSWSPVNTGLDIYAAASASTAKVIESKSTITGAWTKIEFTLPEGGPYYMYFGSEVSATNWKIDGENSYMLIDEFTVNGEVETFNKGIDDSAFEVLYDTAVGIGDGWISPYPGEFGAKIYGDKISGTASTPTFITKEAYTFTETTVVSFDYIMVGNTKPAWWSLCWTSDQKTASIYAHAENNVNYGKEMSKSIADTWTSASVEIPAGTWYFYIALEKNQWNGGYVIIDNFKIGEQVTEDFSYGIEDSIFVVSPFSSHHAAVELADGYVAPTYEEGEYAMKYVFNASGEKVSQVTKQAYAGGSTVSFKYYIPAETTNLTWWGIAWNTDPSKANVYHAAGVEGIGANYKALGTVTGAWTEVSFTLTEGGPYYLYFGSAVSSSSSPSFLLNGGNSYVLIDDFTVNGEVEDFNKPIDDWAFEVLVPGTVVSGDGFVAAPVVENSMLSFNEASIGGNERIAMITDKAYAGVTEITFDAIYAETGVTPYWGLSYTTDPTQFSYDPILNAVNCYTPKLGNLSVEKGVAYTYKFTFSEGKFYMYRKVAGGEYEAIMDGAYTDGDNYFYFVANPKSGTDIVFYLDNFSITYADGTVTDTFNNEKSSLFVESETKIGSGYGSTGMGFVESAF